VIVGISKLLKTVKIKTILGLMEQSNYKLFKKDVPSVAPFN